MIVKFPGGNEITIGIKDAELTISGFTDTEGGPRHRALLDFLKTLSKTMKDDQKVEEKWKKIRRADMIKNRDNSLLAMVPEDIARNSIIVAFKTLSKTRGIHTKDDLIRLVNSEGEVTFTRVPQAGRDMFWLMAQAIEEERKEDV